MLSLGGIWVSLMCVTSVSLSCVVRSMYCGGTYLTWNTSFVIRTSVSVFLGLSILMCEDEDAKCDRKLNFPPQTCSKFFFNIMYVVFWHSEIM